MKGAVATKGICQTYPVTGIIILYKYSICSGQVILATVLYSIQYFFSATLGAKPSLC